MSTTVTSTDLNISSSFEEEKVSSSTLEVNSSSVHPFPLQRDISLNVSSGKKSTLNSSHWYELEHYLELRKEAAICAYVPARGQSKELFCCLPAVNAYEADVSQHRCGKDMDKMGIGAKLLARYNEKLNQGG